MKFFGIDPGTAITGYGIISTQGNVITFERCGVIETKSTWTLPQKLEHIYNGLVGVLVASQPDCVCIEQAFYAKNVHTTLILGHTRGVAMLAAVQSRVEVVEYTPREIKKAIVGKGNATKDQVEFMVKTILKLHQFPHFSDAFDALAASLCAFYHFPGKK